MESIQISATAGAMIGNAPSRSNRLSSSFRLQTLQTSLGLPYRPDRYSRDPAADGVVGQATADTASFLDMELCLPGSESRARPWVQYRNGGKPAEMPTRYHRDVSAASRTEPRSNPILANGSVSDDRGSKLSSRRQTVAGGAGRFPGPLGRSPDHHVRRR